MGRETGRESGWRESGPSHGQCPAAVGPPWGPGSRGPEHPALGRVSAPAAPALARAALGYHAGSGYEAPAPAPQHPPILFTSFPSLSHPGEFVGPHVVYTPKRLEAPGGQGPALIPGAGRVWALGCGYLSAGCVLGGGLHAASAVLGSAGRWSPVLCSCPLSVFQEPSSRDCCTTRTPEDPG